MKQPQRPTPESLTVVDYPDPILRRRAEDVSDIDDWVRGVIVRMKALMLEHEGVGLAAPQVGLPLRLFIYSPTGKAEDIKALINPVLSGEKGSVDGEEGCLSLPDIRAKITRHETLHLEATDENGQRVALDLADYPARIIQHENDHLDGILILDRMSPMAKIAHRKRIKALEQKFQ